MIEFVDVYQHYGVRPTLRHVNLKVEPGELMCVMAPNGMGKTTLLAVAAGIISPIKGKVLIDGMERRSSVETEMAIRQKVCYLPDDPFLPGSLTGRQYALALGRIYGVEDERLMTRTERLLELFDLLEKADHPLGSYSTGQKKKIGLCAAMVTDAPILILDEPFSGGLDSAALHALVKFLRILAERDDITILMAAPVPELVSEVADRIAVINHGEIAACGTLEQLVSETGITTGLADILDALTHPGDANRVDRLLEGWKS